MLRTETAQWMRTECESRNGREISSRTGGTEVLLNDTELRSGDPESAVPRPLVET